jgi:hypothetical protein
MPDVPPTELTNAIAEGRALLVCGAGVSQAATDGQAPGWRHLIREALVRAGKQTGGLAQPWVKGCEIILTSDSFLDWLEVANIIQRKLGGPHGPAYRAFFKQRLGGLKATSPALLTAIAKLAGAGNRVATTNYDHLISRAINCDRADWLDHLLIIEALRGERPAVWHIHGDIDHPNSIVFSQSDYDRIASSEYLQFVQKSTVLNFTLVFIGCSASGLSDDNVGRLLLWLGSSLGGLGDEHFVLVEDDNTELWPPGVAIVRYGNHQNLPAYLHELSSKHIVDLTENINITGEYERISQSIRESNPKISNQQIGILLSNTNQQLLRSFTPDMLVTTDSQVEVRSAGSAEGSSETSPGASLVISPAPDSRA